MPYLFICIVLLLFSCGNNPSEKKTAAPPVPAGTPKENIKYVNGIKIETPAKQENFRFHDPVNLSFTAKERFEVDSAHIFLNGKQIGTTGKGIQTFNFTVPTSKVGPSTLKVTVFHPDNKRSISTQTIVVKPDKAPRKYTYDVVKTYTHDPKAYTQGLVYQDGFLYESTGQYGESGIRKTDMNTGKILSTLNIDSKFFGEGITIYKDKIYQLTWTSRKGFIYDVKSFSLESTFNYNTQGWGITTMGEKLIMSDGSNKLFHIAPSSFNVIKETEVYDNNGPVDRLNELEYIDGLIWANVWMQDRIVLIDPESGEIKGEIDLSRILSPNERNNLGDSDNVLNGIAWNPGKKTVYVTGKRWPKMFELKIRGQAK